MDLAVASFNSGSLIDVSILLGNGDGTFQAQIVVPVVVSAAVVNALLGDFNRDGKLDLIVLGFSPVDTQVSILLGNGNGTFGAAQNFGTGVPFTGGAHAIGDFNGDGKLDVAVPHANANNVAILLGDGNGNLSAPTLFAVGGVAPQTVATADLNKDGILDLVTGDVGSGHISILLGIGNGTFQPGTSMPTGSGFTASIITEDLNGDGKLDLITNGAVFLGQGNGTFQAAINFAAGSAPSLVRSGDFNRDGTLDLVTSSIQGNIVSVHLGNGDGSLRAPRHYVVGHGPDEVQVVDRDGAGTLDLVVSYGSDDHVSVLRGRGDGTFEGAGAYPSVASINGGAFAVAVADFNGDGVPDVVTSDAAFLPGQGLGRLGPPVPLAGLSGSGVVAADWNGDGKMDLAFVGSSSSSPGLARIALGNGNGTFAAPTSLPLPAGFSPFPLERFPLVVDLNNDGKPDLVVANPGANSLSVFLNTGGGSFNAAADVPERRHRSRHHARLIDGPIRLPARLVAQRSAQAAEESDQRMRPDARVMLSANESNQPLASLRPAKLTVEAQRGDQRGTLRLFVQQYGERLNLTVQFFLLFLAHLAQRGNDQITHRAIEFSIALREELQ
jgi:hypothetical protein